MMKFENEIEQISGFQDLDQYCTKLLKRIHRENQLLILLRGDLGAGKTKMIETLLSHLGIKNVSSPTFAIHHHYNITNINIDHFDLYRIESDSDLESTGFWDVFSQTQSWVIIEWADRLNISDLPKSWSQVEIEILFPQPNNSQERVINTQFRLL